MSDPHHQREVEGNCGIARRACVLEPLEARLLLSAAHPGQWILHYEGLSATELAPLAAAAFGDEAVVEDLGVRGYALLSASGAEADAIGAWAAGVAGIQYAQPNYIYQVDAVRPDDTWFEELWGLENLEGPDIRATEAWELTTGSPDVVVAVIDTGVDYTHPDLRDNIWVNPGEVPGNGVDDDGNGFVDDVHGFNFAGPEWVRPDGAVLHKDPMDAFGHGTHVAGTIGAAGNNAYGVAGVNWNVRIMAVQWIGDDGTGTTADAVQAIEYVTAMREAGVNVVASNNSWRASDPYVFDQALHDAIARSGEAGILFVASAGNESEDNDALPRYPASYPLENMISVAAIDDEGELAGFSNYGASSVDLAAPGQGIHSTLPGAGYARLSGTSMAAPHVAGTIALLGSYAPSATAGELRSAVLDGAAPSEALTGTSVTGGVLDARAALEALRIDFPEVVSLSPDGEAPPTDKLVIRFNSPLDPVSVRVENFRLLTAGEDGIFGSADDTQVDLAAADITMPGAATIRFDLPSELPPERYRLTIVGSEPDPVRDLAGRPLQNGGDWVRRFAIAEAPGPLEPNDRLADAATLSLDTNEPTLLQAAIGDGYFGWADVDLYRFDLVERSRVAVRTETRRSDLDTLLRLFDTAGAEIARNDDWYGLDSSLVLTLAPGTYYLGISGWENGAYDPTAGPEGDGPPAAPARPGATGGYGLLVSAVPVAAPAATVTGVLWHDFDANGVRGAPGGHPEPGLAGWTVFLDDGDGVLGPDEPRTTTDWAGTYELSLPANQPGEVRIGVASPDGWAVTGVKPHDAGMDIGLRLTGDFLVDAVDDHASARLDASGRMSLRTALRLAEAYPGADRIIFDASLSGRTIRLVKGELVAAGEVEIVGPDGSPTRIHAAGAGRAVRVLDDADVWISGLELTGGSATYDLGLPPETEFDTLGGAVYNAGTLALHDLTITESRALVGGGGIYNTGTLSLEDVSVSQCRAEDGGGGIANVGTISHMQGVTVSACEAIWGGGMDNRGRVMEMLDVTLRGNLAFGAGVWFPGHGGGLRNSGTIENARRLAVVDNVSEGFGGGIRTDGELRAEDLLLVGNRAGLRGGGMYHHGTTELTRAVIAGNSAQGRGGGVMHRGHGNPLTLRDSTIHGNTSDERGGGLVNDYRGETTLRGVTISENRAERDGGAILNYGVLDLANTTLSGNVAGRSGGGIYNWGDTVRTTNVTITQNRAAAGEGGEGDGGGVAMRTGTVELHNTIVAGNVAGVGPDERPDDVAGTFAADSSHNLVGVIDGSEGLEGVGTRYGRAPKPLDPALGELAENGGPTRTHALLAGSKALDAGSLAAATEANLEADQRGLARFVDGDFDGEARVDIGAFERRPGDLDADGALTASDIDILLRALTRGQSPPEHDLNADGLVDARDADLLIRGLLESEYGDCNLDGRIDAADLSILAAGWMGTASGWAGGDFTGDGAVSASDLSLLGANWLWQRDAAPAEPLAAEVTVTGLPPEAPEEAGQVETFDLSAVPRGTAKTESASPAEGGENRGMVPDVDLPSAGRRSLSHRGRPPRRRPAVETTGDPTDAASILRALLPVPLRMVGPART